LAIYPSFSFPPLFYSQDTIAFPPNKKQPDSGNQEAINLAGIILLSHQSTYDLLFKFQVLSSQIIFKISFKLPLVLSFKERKLQELEMREASIAV